MMNMHMNCTSDHGGEQSDSDDSEADEENSCHIDFTTPQPMAELPEDYQDHQEYTDPITDPDWYWPFPNRITMMLYILRNSQTHPVVCKHIVQI